MAFTMKQIRNMAENMTQRALAMLETHNETQTLPDLGYFTAVMEMLQDVQDVVRKHSENSQLIDSIWLMRNKIKNAYRDSIGDNPIVGYNQY